MLRAPLFAPPSCTICVLKYRTDNLDDKMQTAQLIREDKPILFHYLETRNLRYIYLTLKKKKKINKLFNMVYRHFI